jgi:hypothetical protein
MGKRMTGDEKDRNDQGFTNAVMDFVDMAESHQLTPTRPNPWNGEGEAEAEAEDSLTTTQAERAALLREDADRRERQSVPVLLESDQGTIEAPTATATVRPMMGSCTSVYHKATCQVTDPHSHLRNNHPARYPNKDRGYGASGVC